MNYSLTNSWHSIDRYDDVTGNDTSNESFSLGGTTTGLNSIVVVDVSQTIGTGTNITDDIMDDSWSSTVNGFHSSSHDPMLYDPMLGWYTAATLSALLLAFIVCVGLERAKNEISKEWKRR